MEDIVSWFEVVVFWIPVFFLLFIWMFFNKKSKYKEMKSQMECLENLKDTLLRQNKILDEQTKVFERIADALENKNEPNNGN